MMKVVLRVTYAGVEHNIIGEGRSIYPDCLVEDDEQLYVYAFVERFIGWQSIVEGKPSWKIHVTNTPYKTAEGFFFVTKSSLRQIYKLDPMDECWIDVEEIIPFDDDKEHPYSYSYDERGEYFVTNPFLQDMPEYPFDRDELTKAYTEIIGKSSADELMTDLVCSGDIINTAGDFRIWTEEESTYILHLPSGTIVGWYKFFHIGRCNFCNKPDMTIADLRQFFMLLRNQLLKEPDRVTEPVIPKVVVTEIDRNTYPGEPNEDAILDMSSMYPKIGVVIPSEHTTPDGKIIYHGEQGPDEGDDYETDDN